MQVRHFYFNLNFKLILLIQGIIHLTDDLAVTEMTKVSDTSIFFFFLNQIINQNKKVKRRNGESYS